MITLGSIMDASRWVCVERIDLADIDAIVKLESIGIIPGQEIYVENVYPLKNIITLVINDVTYMLRRNSVQAVLVTDI